MLNDKQRAYLFFLSLANAMALALSAPAFSQDGSQTFDGVGPSLDSAAGWLDALANHGPGRLARPMAVEVLPMNVQNYKAFVRGAYAEPPKDLGNPALSAFLQLDGKVDEKTEDACLLLYNPEAKADLISQFVAPHDTQFGPGAAPYLFMSAHEYGHCLDFRSRGQKKQPLRPPLLGEAYADVFAILLLRHAGLAADEIMSIISSRQNGGTTHSTLIWCLRAIRFPSEKLSNSIEDLAQVADNLVEAHI